ncbi:hypothetical protein FTO74_04700 [Granulicella sp. WH15]|uniref:hypothetical protein n=1 Tax=Granulicella sp. WH15 TaxID=2602070 RepID=UPI0013679520|nr:hypothetical protein [Granulicella sp. WH15]QHN02744.1 hypothetical protein FTO74_04700 [Granulicella sp. WH15]
MITTAVITILILYVGVTEWLDTIGRLEIIEKRWPRMWSIMNNRPIRLALLIFAVVVLVKIWSEKLKGEGVSPLIVNIPAPPAPVIQFIQPDSPQGPKWTFESVAGANGAGIALITANASISNLSFRVKCNFPCTLNEGGSQAIGTQTGIWLDPRTTNDPTIIRVKVRTPNRLNAGQQIALTFWATEPIVAPNPPKQISISWVQIDKED